MTQPISELEKLPLHERLQSVGGPRWQHRAGDRRIDCTQWQKIIWTAATLLSLPIESGIPWETARDLIRGHHG